MLQLMLALRIRLVAHPYTITIVHNFASPGRSIPDAPFGSRSWLGPFCWSITATPP
jgi:hypothetical protein